MEIVHGDLIFNRGIAEVIGLAVNESRFKSAASDECGKAIGVVVPTIGFFDFSVLAEGGSAELATPYDDGDDGAGEASDRFWPPKPHIRQPTTSAATAPPMAADL